MLISSDGAKQESNAYRLPTCHPPAHHSNATKDIPRPSHHSGRCIKERSWWMWQRRTEASAGKAAGQYYSTPLLEAAGSSTGRRPVDHIDGRRRVLGARIHPLCDRPPVEALYRPHQSIDLQQQSIFRHRY